MPESDPNGRTSAFDPAHAVLKTCSAQDLQLRSASAGTDLHELAETSAKAGPGATEQADACSLTATREGLTSSVPEDVNASRESDSRAEIDDWFNQQAFEEPPQDIDADAETPGSSKRSGPSQRRQANNRVHQRTWRLKNKVQYLYSTPFFDPSFLTDCSCWCLVFQDCRRAHKQFSSSLLTQQLSWLS